jgi:hypothetical protein
VVVGGIENFERRQWILQLTPQKTARTNQKQPAF